MGWTGYPGGPPLQLGWVTLGARPATARPASGRRPDRARAGWLRPRRCTVVGGGVEAGGWPATTRPADDMHTSRSHRCGAAAGGGIGNGNGSRDRAACGSAGLPWAGGCCAATAIHAQRDTSERIVCRQHKRHAQGGVAGMRTFRAANKKGGPLHGGPAPARSTNVMKLCERRHLGAHRARVICNASRRRAREAGDRDRAWRVVCAHLGTRCSSSRRRHCGDRMSESDACALVPPRSNL